MLPVLTVLSAAWFTAMVIAFMTVLWSYGHFNVYGWPHGGWSHGAFGWPHDLPRWIPLVAIVGVYALIAMPIGAARRASLYYANGGRLHGWADAWSGLLWIALVAVVLCAAWQFTPWLHDLLQQVVAGSQRIMFT
jgi:hypothetical protein